MTDTPVVAPVQVKTPKVKKAKTPKEKKPKGKKVKEPKEKKPKEQKEKKPRRVVTKETLKSSFELLQKQLDDEIKSKSESSDKQVGFKFLRALNKSFKTLQRDLVRVLKLKPKTARKLNENSGFLKKVKISHELSDFAGWKRDELHSRAEVTKVLCNYVQEHKLKDPAKRKRIVPDEKLSKLLRFNPSNPPLNPRPKPGHEGEKITELGFGSLQQLVQVHFVKETK